MYTLSLQDALPIFYRLSKYEWIEDGSLRWFKDPVEQLLSICQDRKCELALLKRDFTPNCFSKYKIIRVLDHDLSVCITQDDKIKLLRVGGGRSLSSRRLESLPLGQGERDTTPNNWLPARHTCGRLLGRFELFTMKFFF